MHYESSNVTLPQLSPKSIKTRTSPSVFSKDQLSKYRHWFVGLSKNKQATVPLNELAVLFISTGISRNRKLFDDMFDMAPGATLLSFEQFMECIEASVLSRKLSVNALGVFLSEDETLSTDTILHQERRKLLMQHIVDRPSVRAWGVEQACDSSGSYRSHRRGRMKSTSEISKICDQERADTTEIVQQLTTILDTEKERASCVPPPAHPPKKPPPILVPIEELLSKDILACVDANPPDLFDRSGNLRTVCPPLCSGGEEEGSEGPPTRLHSFSSTSEVCMTHHPLTYSLSYSLADSFAHPLTYSIVCICQMRDAASAARDPFSRPHTRGLVRSHSEMVLPSHRHSVSADPTMMATLAEVKECWIMKKTCAISSGFRAAQEAALAPPMVRLQGHRHSSMALPPGDITRTCAGEGKEPPPAHFRQDDSPPPRSLPACNPRRRGLIRWRTYKF